MTDHKNLAYRILRLSPDEQTIMKQLITRLEQGRATYGIWKVSEDTRNLPGEALEEVLDALHYVSAELIKLSKLQEKPTTPTGQPRKVFICCNEPDDTLKYLNRIYAISEGLVGQSLVPVVPLVGIDKRRDSVAPRDQVRDMRNELISQCTEVHVFGSIENSPLLKDDLLFADSMNIPITFVEETTA